MNFDTMVTTYYAIPVLLAALFVGYILIRFGTSGLLETLRGKNQVPPNIVFVIANSKSNFDLYRQTAPVSVHCIFIDGSDSGSRYTLRGHSKPDVVVFGESQDMLYYSEIIKTAKFADARIRHCQ